MGQHHAAAGVVPGQERGRDHLTGHHRGLELLAGDDAGPAVGQAGLHLAVVDAGDLHLHDATHDHARAAGTGCARGAGGRHRTTMAGRTGAGPGAARGRRDRQGGRRRWRVAAARGRSTAGQTSTATRLDRTRLRQEQASGATAGSAGPAAPVTRAVLRPPPVRVRAGARVGGTRRALFPGRTGCRSPYRRPHDPDPAAPGLRWPPSRDRECVPWSRSGATTPCVSDRCCSPWWTRPRATRSPTTVGTNRTTSTPGASSAPGCSPGAAGSAPGS